ncbi:hypothetical protein GCM10025867_50800 (plasmid) [Frondihabitans sucicola]|uniref:Uncharacterized protein n=1 Tax=Frondihabitans sucicola TaxID=1268041 RepID=A0ABN6Y708_9MICO|nr:hypothetical protein [Frondihabitans sucicola]BDZ52839.1 hypothetical protein GCM10025867_50800 [Frondihabitans sucicola]
MSIAMIEDAPSARGIVKRRGAAGKASPHDEQFRATIIAMSPGWPHINLTKSQSHFLSRKRKRLDEGTLSPRQSAFLDIHLPGWQNRRRPTAAERAAEAEREYVVEAVDGSLFDRVDSQHLAWLSDLGRRASRGELNDEQTSFLDARLAGWRTFREATAPVEGNPGSIVVVNAFLDLAARGVLGDDMDAALTWLQGVRHLAHDRTLLPEIERVIDRDLPGWRAGSIASVVRYYSMGLFPSEDISRHDRAFLTLLRGGSPRPTCRSTRPGAPRFTSAGSPGP